MTEASVRQEFPEIEDPFGVFLKLHRRSLPPNRGPKRFNSGEHVWLGGRGADLACEQLAQIGILVEKDLFISIPRRSGSEELQYGEMVALSGDFYKTPDAFYEETPSSISRLWKDNDLDDLRRLFNVELRWIEDRVADLPIGTTYPVENVRFAWNAKAYVELALNNTDHFGWHNVCVYQRRHADALQLALDARGRENDTFSRALYTNAFADHFLTDAFAAGHIRVPRAEIRAWASKRGLNDKIAGALSKVLHDQDGHINIDSLHSSINENARGADDGLLVQDSTGETWTTRCDGQLFMDSASLKSVAVERAVFAVAASVRELVIAWKEGQLPRDIYEATRYVPFPHKEESCLTTKFSKDMTASQFQELWKSVSWYSKIPWITGLNAEHLREMFTALPEIMAEFRTNVRDQADVNKKLIESIAPAYVAAYRQIC